MPEKKLILISVMKGKKATINKIEALNYLKLFKKITLQFHILLYHLF